MWSPESQGRAALMLCGAETRENAALLCADLTRTTPRSREKRISDDVFRLSDISQLRPSEGAETTEILGLGLDIFTASELQ